MNDEDTQKVGLIVLAAIITFVVMAAIASTLTPRNTRAEEAGRTAQGVADVQRMLNDDRVYSTDTNSLNRSLGEPVRLRTKGTEVEVTPERVSTGTDPCAPGPLTTVHLSSSGSLPIETFALVNTDNSMSAPIPACSSATALVFAGDKADRLVAGGSPAAPAAMWQVS